MFKSIAAIVALAGILTLSGCGGSGGTSTDTVRNELDPKVPEPKVPATETGGGKAPAPKTGGQGEAYDAAKATCVIKGVVSFEGKAPKMFPVNVTEPVCKDHHGAAGLKEERFVVTEKNTVPNVVVYVSDGFQKYNFDSFSPAPARINQLGCQYTPHALAMKTDQVLEIESSDAVTHNVHISSQFNGEQNISQNTKGISPTKPHFGSAELGMQVKCDVHGWMRATISTFDHPFFAVTDENGAFEIKVPPGTYKIATWQETQTPLDKPKSWKFVPSAAVDVTVAADKPAEANFKYTAKP